MKNKVQESNPVQGPNDPVEISSIAFGGKGIARVGGKIYFVADAIPGDLVEIDVVSDSARYAEARIRTFVRKSSARGPSVCRYSDYCGGCLWQGVPYEQQLSWKRQFVETAIRRIGRVETNLRVPISGSPMIQGYRNRIFLRGIFQANGQVVFGYFRRASRELVPIDRCAIADAEINKLLETIAQKKFKQQALSLHDVPFRMEIQRVQRSDQSGPGVVVTVYPPEPKCRDLDDFIVGLREISQVVWAGLIGAAVSKGAADPSLANPPLVVFEDCEIGDQTRKSDRQTGEIRYLTRPGQFQQVNVEHNEHVRSLVSAVVDSYAPKRILDLFCGSGNLSLGLCHSGRYVEGIEFSEVAIATARENVRINHLSNAVYLAGSAEKHLWKCAKKGEVFDVIIADPPRDGMFKELIPIQKIGPQAIIYVSCDPATLARDLGALIRGGYHLRMLRAFDFFPNTWHVESVAVLER